MNAGINGKVSLVNVTHTLDNVNPQSSNASTPTSAPSVAMRKEKQ